MRELLLKLCRREDLTREEARTAFDELMSGRATEAQIGGLLVGLAAKGSTVEELVGAAEVMREKVVPIIVPAGAVVLDTCGTGGSKARASGLFNISTAAALIVAACGVTVVKHGNRSASSRSGSADVLEALGVKLDQPADGVTRCVASAGIGFAFARNHHPAMKHVAAARTALGIPTVFNLLGPLTNPAGARHQLLGVFAPELTDRLAAVLRELGSVRAWVVHGEDGLDELSTVAPTRVSELRNGRVTSFTVDAASVGLPAARLDDLRVGSVAESADAIVAILSGKAGPKRDIVAFNAASGLVVCGAAPDLRAAMGMVDDTLATDAGMAVLQKLRAASRH